MEHFKKGLFTVLGVWAGLALSATFNKWLIGATDKKSEQADDGPNQGMDSTESTTE